MTEVDICGCPRFQYCWTARLPVDKQTPASILPDNEGIELAVCIISPEGDATDVPFDDTHRHLVGEVAEIGTGGGAGGEEVRVWFEDMVGTILKRTVCIRFPLNTLTVVSEWIYQFDVRTEGISGGNRRSRSNGISCGNRLGRSRSVRLHSALSICRGRSIVIGYLIIVDGYACYGSDDASQYHDRRHDYQPYSSATGGT